MKRALGKDESPGSPEFLVDWTVFSNELEDAVPTEEIKHGYKSGTDENGDYVAFTITFKNPLFAFDEEEIMDNHVSTINSLVFKHVTNAADFDFYEINFEKSELTDNKEERHSIIITQDLNESIEEYP